MLFLILAFSISSLWSVEISKSFKTEMRRYPSTSKDIFHITYNSIRKQYSYYGLTEDVVCGILIPHNAFYQKNGQMIDYNAGQCRKIPGDIGSWFDWLEDTKYVSDQVIDGQNCQLYQYVTPGNVTVSACLRKEDHIPVYVNDGVSSTGFLFFNQSEGDFEVVIPEVCSLPLNVCHPETPAVQTMEMTRFHAKGEYSLSNQNTGTMMGDVLFICYDLALEGSTSDYQMISIFEVELNTSFGQYAMCNNGICTGGLIGTVGKEVALGYSNNSYWGGQCQENKKQGSWYSLQGRDECSDDEEIGTNRCAWKKKAVKKTISVDCVISHGLKEACQKDGTPPFTMSLNIVQKAFDSEEFSQGGCPNLFGI